MALPIRLRRFAYLDIRDVDAVEPDAALSKAGFQIIHRERGHGHIVDVQLGLCARYHQPNMEPDVSRDARSCCEAGAVVNLPRAYAVKYRRILLSVVQSRLMRP